MPEFKTLRQKAGDELGLLVGLTKNLLYIAGIVAGLFTGLWWLLEPRLTPWVSLPQTLSEGVERLTLEIDDIHANIEILQRRMAATERGIDDLQPPDRIAEYDLARSRILTPACVRGEWCEGVYVLRRTEFGINFQRPSGEAIVENEGGIRHPVSELETNNGGGFFRVGSEWTRAPFRFRVPVDTRPGIGLFYYNLVYVGPDESRREKSFPLAFEIVDP